MNMLGRFKHWLLHLTGWNGGHVYSWKMDGSGEGYIGFRCATCGKVTGYPMPSQPPR